MKLFLKDFNTNIKFFSEYNLAKKKKNYIQEYFKNFGEVKIQLRSVMNGIFCSVLYCTVSCYTIVIFLPYLNCFTFVTLHSDAKITNLLHVPV